MSYFYIIKITISIHALLAESDGNSFTQQSFPDGFLSTLSLRRATTTKIAAPVLQHRFLSTLSLRRATSSIPLPPYHFLFLSTLSLRRATSLADVELTIKEHFYPRSPCGERQFCALVPCHNVEISIHALLAESDCPRQPYCRRPRNFYPRSPCGERQDADLVNFVNRIFLSTLSLRRATACLKINDNMPEFLSTLSLRRATRA